MKDVDKIIRDGINKGFCEWYDEMKYAPTIIEADKTEEEAMAYKPTCPRGYTDCVYDPAYIKYHHPEWYEELYGNKTLEEATGECKEKVAKDPDEKYYCYDDEDK